MSHSISVNWFQSNCFLWSRKTLSNVPLPYIKVPNNKRSSRNRQNIVTPYFFCTAKFIPGLVFYFYNLSFRSVISATHGTGRVKLSKWTDPPYILASRIFQNETNFHFTHYLLVYFSHKSTMLFSCPFHAQNQCILILKDIDIRLKFNSSYQNDLSSIDRFQFIVDCTFFIHECYLLDEYLMKMVLWTNSWIVEGTRRYKVTKS